MTRKAPVDPRDAEIARLRRELAVGSAAAAILNELVALVPIKDLVVTSATGASLIAYFREQVQRAEAATEWRPTHRHLKGGSAYAILGDAQAQVSNDERARVLREGDKLTVYRAKDESLWVRFPDEFNDGRFEALSKEEGSK